MPSDFKLVSSARIAGQEYLDQWYDAPDEAAFSPLQPGVTKENDKLRALVESINHGCLPGDDELTNGAVEAARLRGIRLLRDAGPGARLKPEHVVVPIGMTLAQWDRSVHPKQLPWNSNHMVHVLDPVSGDADIAAQVVFTAIKTGGVFQKKQVVFIPRGGIEASWDAQEAHFPENPDRPGIQKRVDELLARYAHLYKLSTDGNSIVGVKLFPDEPQGVDEAAASPDAPRIQIYRDNDPPRQWPVAISGVPKGAFEWGVTHIGSGEETKNVTIPADKFDWKPAA